MPTCPLCTLEHDFIHRSATTNEVLPGDCIKALHALVQGGPMPYHRERDAKLGELAARIEPLEARVESLRGRVAKLEDAAAAPCCKEAPTSDTAGALPEGFKGVTSAELNAAIDEHLEAGGAVVLAPPDAAAALEQSASDVKES